MKKPLELHVYPTWDDGSGRIYADKGDPMRPTAVQVEVLRTRFSDTELAAEYHAADAAYLQEVLHMDTSGITFLDLMRENRVARTFLRFATLEHAV